MHIHRQSTFATDVFCVALFSTITKLCNLSIVKRALYRLSSAAVNPLNRSEIINLQRSSVPLS